MNNNNWKNRDLAHTNADVKPQGVIFTISDRDVRNFYENYFANLDGFRTVRIFGEKGGRAGNKLQAFAFFDATSAAFARLSNNSSLFLANAVLIMNPPFRNNIVPAAYVSLWDNTIL